MKKKSISIAKARTNHDYELEEDLYSKLLFLHRSPETLIQITKLNQAMAIERWDITIDESTSDRKIQLMQRKLDEKIRLWNNLNRV